jgi:hypothetical protein
MLWSDRIWKSCDSHDSTHDFQILSLQSICAFAMGFGWAGLAGLKGTQWSAVTINGVAFAVGAGLVWALAMMLRAMAELQTSGNIPIAAAEGREGDVYVTVASGGSGGQVRITLNERQRIYNAITRGEDLATGTRIRVVKVNDDNTLTVVRA